MDGHAVENALRIGRALGCSFIRCRMTAPRRTSKSSPSRIQPIPERAVRKRFAKKSYLGPTS